VFGDNIFGPEKEMFVAFSHVSIYHSIIISKSVDEVSTTTVLKCYHSQNTIILFLLEYDSFLIFYYTNYRLFIYNTILFYRDWLNLETNLWHH